MAARTTTGFTRGKGAGRSWRMNRLRGGFGYSGNETCSDDSTRQTRRAFRGALGQSASGMSRERISSSSFGVERGGNSGL